MLSEEVEVATPPVPSDPRPTRRAHRPTGKRARISSLPLERVGARWARRVALDDIERSDTRFQYRLVVSHDDLVESLQSQGQLNPVLLWGDRPPYTIVDGFRRIDAIAALGGDSVQAAFIDSKDETRIFAISFAENVRRKSLTAHDKANAIWRAIHVWELDKSQVAESLGLSIRQVDRYLKLLELSAVLQEPVIEGRIRMAHAVLLHRANLPDPSEWIERIAAEGISAKELRRRLGRSVRRNGPKTYLVQDSKGFHVRQVRYRRDMSVAEKRRIWDSLERALKLIAESS